MQLVVDALLFLMLLTMTIFMLVNHLRLQKFLKESSQMPHLTAEFTKSLEKAQQTMKQLVHTSQTEGALLTKQIEEATKLSTEIDYLLHRAQKVMSQSENTALMAPLLAEDKAVPTPVSLSDNGSDLADFVAKQAQKQDLFAKEEYAGKSAIKPAGPVGAVSAYAQTSVLSDDFDDVNDTFVDDERAFLTKSYRQEEVENTSAQDKLRLALEEALK